MLCTPFLAWIVDDIGSKLWFSQMRIDCGLSPCRYSTGLNCWLTEVGPQQATHCKITNGILPDPPINTCVGNRKQCVYCLAKKSNTGCKLECCIQNLLILGQLLAELAVLSAWRRNFAARSLLRFKYLDRTFATAVPNLGWEWFQHSKAKVVSCIYIYMCH